MYVVTIQFTKSYNKANIYFETKCVFFYCIADIHLSKITELSYENNIITVA